MKRILTISDYIDAINKAHPNPSSLMGFDELSKSDQQRILFISKRISSLQGKLLPERPNYFKKTDCNCPCHTGRNIKHIVPCCDNRYIELFIMPKLKK